MWRWASRETKLVVVICGSAASWMLDKIVRQRGGLHDRVTRRVRLEPFSLSETAELLRERHVELGAYQTIEPYMAFGGIPHYLSQVRAGRADGVWMKKQGTPAWRAWTGLAFEAVCMKHVLAIKRALGISDPIDHDGGAVRLAS